MKQPDPSQQSSAETQPKHEAEKPESEPRPSSWHADDASMNQTDEVDDTEHRSDSLASQITPDNEFRIEQETEQQVDENINTDPATLEESGEISSPPGASVSSEEKE